MKKIILKTVAVSLLLLITIGFSACDENNNLVLFSIQNDIDLGKQVSDEIAKDPTTYPVLDRATNADAYAYLDAMTNSILNSGEVAYKDEFAWELHIIDDPNTLNAFATPGGYIYVYTGLIKYLDRADDLAGVMGHEIAHADLRHTSRNIQKEKTVSFLLSILLGNDSGEIANIAAELAAGAAYLKFGREFEKDSDEQSVVYLDKTNYACDGAASFFEKLESEGNTGSTPAFLSTHPPADSRISEINAKAIEVGCRTTGIVETGMDYATFKTLFN